MKNKFAWMVCPIQGRQLRDVHTEDLFGDFRLCNTYRGGGGYDQFPKIYSKRHGVKEDNSLGQQFVVQLYGCTLDCPYCYVTRDGIFGKTKAYTTEQLVAWFRRSRCSVFHLMGGAPAIYLDRWYEIINFLSVNEIFHSDLMLVERDYKPEYLELLGNDNVLSAVNIKGVTPEDFKRNTNTKLNETLFWSNFDRIVEAGVNFYLTFTNPDLSYLDTFKEKLVKRYGESVLEDSFVIDLIEYDALK